MKKESNYISPKIWVIETKPAMPLCTSVTIEGFANTDDDFNMFNNY